MISFTIKLAAGGDYSWGKSFGALSADVQFWLGSVNVAVDAQDDALLAELRKVTEFRWR